MKHAVLLVVAGVFLTIGAGCADTLSIQAKAFRLERTEPIKRVAIVDFAGKSGHAAADMLTMHLQRFGFDVVERQYLTDLLGEISATETGRTEATVTERISKLGRLLNADAMITGDLVRSNPPRFARKDEDRLAYQGASCELSVRAFDMRTREVFWTTWISVAATAKTGEQLGILDYLNEACAEVAASFASEHYEDGLHIYKGPAITAHQQRRHGEGTAAGT